MNIELVPKQTLIIEQEKYSAWPRFEHIGSQRIGGLWRCQYLQHALVEQDLACAAWRASIPTEILKLLQGFTDCHAELIEMAQAVPAIFVRWARSNPAFTVLAATYWTYRSADHVPNIEARISLWENLNPRDILHHTRCEPSKSFLKVLRKIPSEHCYDFVISRLREQWQIPEKKRLLRHLKRITMETTWLLSCFPPLLDPGIHALASSAPRHNEFHVGHIVGDLTTRREIQGLAPWPYRNRIHSWEQLLAAYDRFLHKTKHVPERFEPPPIDGVETERIKIQAITSRTALGVEALEMENCIGDYLAQIYQNECYAYRLLSPERATVLIDRRLGRWSIAQAMLKANKRQVRSKTWNQLIDWVMSAQN